MKEYIFPTRIVKFENASNVEHLLKKVPLQIGTSDTEYAVFEKNSYVILDYGTELCGGIKVIVPSCDKNAKIRIRFGESVTETCSTLGGEQNATNDHSLRDFEVALPTCCSQTNFGDTAFRFVRIDFSEKTLIKCIAAENHILKRKPVYTYEGKDELIKKIFDTAKRTIDLCASSGYMWDGAKRDRLVWIGDMHPQMLAITTLYGASPEFERSMVFAKKQTPLPNWINGYPMYSMWWITNVADYYKKTGRKEFTRRQISYVEGIVDLMLSCVKENGELNYPSYYVDWPTSNTPDELHGVRAINVMAAKNAIMLLGEFNKDTSKANELLNRLQKQQIAPASSKSALGLKFFATDLTEQDKQNLVAYGAKGITCFMSYYILKAVASFDKQMAINMLKEYFGAMLSKGATTFWEDFSIDWVEGSSTIDDFPKENEKDIHGDFGGYCYKGFRHSLCHGWSAGIIQFIKEECE
ncbi:MAG: alpha-L-rhamnosidase [Clostridia bacterium]|nr:alpha-L-rhamnosidase [Clostridia bacterium]